MTVATVKSVTQMSLPPAGNENWRFETAQNANSRARGQITQARHRHFDALQGAVPRTRPGIAGVTKTPL